MTIPEQLRRHSAPAILYEKAGDGKVRCLACAHKCSIPPGGTGICRVRFNEGGVLKAPWGYISSAGLDPVEKKPFFHALPGSLAFSFGMPGCNFRCRFCQNYELSQAGRDPLCGFPGFEPASPESLAAAARDAGAAIAASTYNEPLITAEWSAAIFKEAAKFGIKGAYVSNGYATEEALAHIKPYVQLYKADLKTFDPDNYRKTIGADLEKVLRGIELVHEKGFWLEIVTLFIPGFNDGPDEMEAIAGFIAGLSRDIPWHVTAFHPDYEMTDRGATPARTLAAARETGLKKGLKFVYTGNIAGAGSENTMCPACGKEVISRSGFRVSANRLKPSAGGGASCPSCGADIPGVWR